jgi:hypothetical protein
VEVMSPVIRPLSDKEKRAIQKQIVSIKNRARPLRRRVVMTGLAVFGSLSALTILLSETHWLVPIILFTIVGGLICWSVLHQEERTNRERIRQLESVLNQGSVREFRIQASNVVEFEEEEDEGACFAFQYAPDQLVFISGQEFYESSKFPNNDFSLIHIEDLSGNLVEFFIEKRGQKLRPDRIVAAMVKSKLKIPEHLTCVSGNLNDLEKLLT